MLALEDRQSSVVDTQPSLNEKQAAVLSEIARYHEVTGEPCRASYLARRLSLSREAVRVHAAALWRKGWLCSQDSPSRLRRAR